MNITHFYDGDELIGSLVPERIEVVRGCRVECHVCRDWSKRFETEEEGRSALHSHYRDKHHSSD